MSGIVVLVVSVECLDRECFGVLVILIMTSVAVVTELCDLSELTLVTLIFAKHYIQKLVKIPLDQIP